ncbi:uncharacterized protein [Bemisia tabaci]|uniref:uncharacterized protein n=1 Tax=Bemisia tabaci TaxID=7038 RepID=UPI003B282F34
MAPNPNLNLFSLINEKNMERALFKDCRVKRLKAEVEKRKGFKVAAYSASLILEENLSVDAAATVICNHIVENENHGKRKEKLNKETNQNRERSRSRSSSKTRKYPDRNEATKPTKGSHKVETNQNRERSRSRSSSKTRKYPDRNEATKPTKGSHKVETNQNRERSRSRSSSKTRKYPDRNEATKPTKGSHKVETVSFCFIFALPIWTYFNQTELRAFTSDFSCGGFNVRLLIGRPKLMSSMNNLSLFFICLRWRRIIGKI